MVGVDQSEAAEEVRQHLVSLRGGAAFLSPEDADLLHSWLNEGITSPQIILALERAADARRKRPRRVPLSLGAARRHLGKTAKPRPISPSAARRACDHPLGALAATIAEASPDDPRCAELQALATALLGLSTDDRMLLEIRAQALFRDFMLQAWESMSTWERDARLTTAREELSAVASTLSAAALDAAAEELARDQLRRAYPSLTAATLRQVLSP